VQGQGDERRFLAAEINEAAAIPIDELTRVDPALRQLRGL